MTSCILVVSACPFRLMRLIAFTPARAAVNSDALLQAHSAQLQSLRLLPSR
ncbi:MAG TPA: hypothetical protein VIJ31_11470 [Acidothermaceae bacterium]